MLYSAYLMDMPILVWTQYLIACYYCLGLCMYLMTIICYILLLKTKGKGCFQYCCEPPMGCYRGGPMTPAYGCHLNIFEFVDCVTGGNVSLCIVNNHILYYHMDVFRSAIRTWLLLSPDYFLANGGSELISSSKPTPYYGTKRFLIYQILYLHGWVLS